MDYMVYFIENAEMSRTYVGCTNNETRRLRQHNGELVGGAKACRTGRPWHVVLQVKGFKDRQQALQFEWMMHHIQPRGGASVDAKGVHRRVKQLWNVVKKERWTTRAPLASSVPLTIHALHPRWNTMLSTKTWPAHVTISPNTL